MKITVDGRNKTQAVRLNLTVDNQFDYPGRWFRGSLHSHIQPDCQEAFFRQYVQLGLDFTAATNYLHITPRAPQVSSSLTCISGAELFWPAQKDLTHIIALGIHSPVAPLDGTMRDVQRAVQDIAHQGGLAVLAHPCWSGYSWEELSALADTGIHAFEVCNRNCWAINGKGRSEELWQLLLDSGHLIPVTGADDVSRVHQHHVLGQCWTGVLADDNTPEAILAAVRAGRCYASEGPQLQRIRFTPDGRILVRSSSCVACHIRSRGFGIRSSVSDTPAQEFSVDLRTEGYRIRDWIAVCVEDEQGRRAWSSAIAVTIRIEEVPAV